MPIPKPNDGESERDYIGRCMGAESMQEYDQDQRAAVCYQTWRDHHGRAAIKEPGERVYKTYAAEVKTEGEPRRITFTISTAAIDRDNDTIDPKGWKLENYRKNPTVLFAHDYKSLPVARAIEIRQTEQGLSSTAEFPPAGTYAFADTVYDMVKAGFLNSTSVGFRPVRDKWTRNDERGGIDFHEQELLEWSIVPVPSNPEALVEMRSKGVTEEQLDLWAKACREWWEKAAAPAEPVAEAKSVTVEVTAPEPDVPQPPPVRKASMTAMEQAMHACTDAHACAVKAAAMMDEMAGGQKAMSQADRDTMRQAGAYAARAGQHAETARQHCDSAMQGSKAPEPTPEPAPTVKAPEIAFDPKDDGVLFRLDVPDPDPWTPALIAEALRPLVTEAAEKGARAAKTALTGRLD